MGGYGSGRNNRHATKTDELLSIDLLQLNRRGLLGRTGAGRISWSRGGEVHSHIGYVAGLTGIELSYVHGGSERVQEYIPYAFTGQHLGGQRAWFTCLSCGRRARILYGGKHFRCRTCYGAVYPSQYTPFCEGKVNRALQIRERLNPDPLYSGVDDPFPPKPKGMHWKTYESLVRELHQGSNQFFQLVRSMTSS